MVKNFLVDQNNALVSGSKLFDLHNCYAYKGIMIQGSRVLKMFFEPDEEYSSGQAPIMLKFTDVSSLETSPNFGAAEISDLEEIGYKATGDKDDNWLMNEQQASQNDDLFFRFSGEHFIRVNSRMATLHLGKKDEEKDEREGVGS